MDASGSEASLRDLKAAPLAQQNILHRHARVDEIDLRVAVRRMIVAEHGQLPQPLHSRGAHGHENHRLLAVVRGARIGLAHEDQDLAARVARAGSPPLAAVDHVVIAVAHDGGLNIRGIAGGDIRLGHRKGGADAPLEQRLEPARLLRRRRIARQHLHVAGIRRRTIEGFRRQMRTSHDFAQGSVLQIREPGAMLGMRQEQVPQIFRPRLVLQFLHDRRGLPGIAGAAVLVHLFVEARLGRVDMSVHETLHLFLQVANLLTVRKIHACSFVDYASNDRCTNAHACSASGRARRPASSAVALEALPCRARASTPCRIPVSRNMLNAR